MSAVSDQPLARRRQTAAAASPPPVGETFPLSFAQQRLWFIEQLQPGSALYNQPDVWRLRGPIDTGAFENALNELVRRHGSLRTTFGVVDGSAVQRVAPFERFTLPRLDLRSAAEPEAVAKLLIQQELSTPFNLERGPLFRPRLLRLSETEHIAIFTAHHIIWDGWSIELFRRELAALYNAFVEGRPSPLPELPMQYADFAVWQRNEARGETWDEQLSYWKRRLQGPLPVMELPADFPRPAQATIRGATEFCLLEPVLTIPLRALSRKQGATLFMTLLAAFKVLLQRYTRQEDVIIGLPIAGRDRSETEHLIGFFVNTLVLRSDLSGDPTFVELLARVRNVTLEAYANQEMPFERIVQELQPERNVNRNPMFEVMFGFEGRPAADWALNELEVSLINPELGTAKFDWTFLLQETADGILGTFEYCADLFKPETIRRVLRNYRTLLEGIVANPDRRISDLPLLTAAEEEQVLVECNRTEAPYPRERCVHELFEAQAEKTPDTTAVVCGDQPLTYRELNERANQLAERLRGLGVGPDACVGLCLERSPELAVAILAILKAGGAYVPLDASYPKDRLARMLETAQPVAILTQKKFVRDLPDNSASTLCVDALEPFNPQSAIRNPQSAAPTAEQLAYVIFTSGSTGVPKGVAMPHRPLVNLITWQAAHFDTAPAARTAQFASCGFDVSFQEMFSTWGSGGTLVFVPEELRRDPAGLWRFLAAQKIERLFLPFVALQQLAETAAALPDVPASLREVITAGEQLRVTPQIVALFERLPGAVLCNHYGPSETHVVTTFTLKGPPATWPALPPIGRPIANTSVYLLDTHRRPVPLGVPGELYLGGDCVARGYLNRPELTTEKFVPDPFLQKETKETKAGENPAPQTFVPFVNFCKHSGLLYRTGDLARWADGELQFLGRVDFELKVRGYRVDPAEVEAVLSQHGDVAQTIVIGRENGQCVKDLVAYVVPRAGAKIEAGRLREFLAAKLPDYLVPSHFVPLDKLPLTANGKVDRRALPSPVNSPRTEAGLVAPRTPVEKALAEIWSEVLECQTIGVRDNFFHLGGHSLLASRLVSRIGKALQVEVPVRVVFEAPTLEAMAARIGQAPRLSAAGQAGIAKRIYRAQAEELLARINTLSDAEVEDLLRVPEQQVSP